MIRTNIKSYMSLQRSGSSRQKNENQTHTTQRSAQCTGVLCYHVVSVCPSVCHTLVLCWNDWTKDDVVFTQQARPGTVVYSDVNTLQIFQGFYPNEAITYNYT